jgi:hypothetical protein
MSKNKNTPLRAFEIVFFSRWYYVEIYNEKKIEVFTESEEDLNEEEIKLLVKYIKTEGFLDSEFMTKS